MTKADLVDVVYDRHGGLTKNEAAEIVEAIFKTVKTSLREGRTVRIKNFGTFEITNRPGRSGVNPVSGERIFIPPHRGLSFRPARRLKDVPGNDRSAGPEHAAGSASSAGSSRPAISARAERD
jgi:integration host factor subunit alpha